MFQAVPFCTTVPTAQTAAAAISPAPSGVLVYVTGAAAPDRQAPAAHRIAEPRVCFCSDITEARELDSNDISERTGAEENVQYRDIFLYCMIDLILALVVRVTTT